MDIILKHFDRKPIGTYTTQARLLPRQRAGHYDLSIFLKKAKIFSGDLPLVKGIYSKGNASQNIQAWFDFHYSDMAVFPGEEPLILSRGGSLAEQTFQMIGKSVPPGGMLFVSVITDLVWNTSSSLHRITSQCLSMRSLSVPPVATPLGRLLFISGCSCIKSQGFDVQGSSRLAAEKALHPKVERQFLQSIQAQIQDYLGNRELTGFAELHKICRSNAKNVLKRLSGH